MGFCNVWTFTCTEIKQTDYFVSTGSGQTLQQAPGEVSRYLAQILNSGFDATLPDLFSFTSDYSFTNWLFSKQTEYLTFYYILLAEKYFVKSEWQEKSKIHSVKSLKYSLFHEVVGKFEILSQRLRI